MSKDTNNSDSSNKPIITNEDGEEVKIGLKSKLKDKAGEAVDATKTKVADTGHAIKQKATDIKDGAVNTVTAPVRGVKRGKDRVVHAYKGVKKNVDNFKAQKGIKNKAKFVAGGIGKKAGKKWKDSETRQRIKKMAKTIKNIVKIIKAIYIPLCITLGIILLVSNLIIWGYSVAQAVGSTPHYYCYIQTDDAALKKSAKYQQYCANGGGLDLSELNGHYVIQSGSGPCTSCATLNLWMRYYVAKGYNIFDYMWNAEGNISLETGENKPIVFNAIRQGNAGYSNSGFMHKDATIAAWMSNHGKSGGYSTMGYVYNEDTFEEKTDLTQSDDWTFTTLLGNKYDTDYGCVGWNNGSKVTIEGDTIEMVSETNTSNPQNMNTTYLQQLLQDHPSGVVVYFNYPGKGYGSHGILITKYEDGKFFMVDSALRKNAPFEMPVENESVGVLWEASVNVILGKPGYTITGFHYIKNDVAL